MQYSPPPLFKQGAPARVKMVIFSLIAIVLLISDARLHTLTLLRQVVGTVLYPLEKVALAPRDAAYAVGDYFSSLSALQNEIKELKRQQVANSLALQQARQLNTDNTQLRKLLDSRERLPMKSLLGEILYDTRDAFTRKIVLDRGSRDSVVPGQPVIDDLGVVGQVTRVFPFTSEVTLLTDKDQAIPVQVVRNGLRSVAYGRGQAGVLDLRFMAANADIKPGDVLVTSGIDGVYPPGLTVAKVAEVENNAAGAFGRIICQPVAGIDRNKQLLIVLADMNIMPRPQLEVSKDKNKFGKRARESAKEAAKESAKAGAAEPAREAGKEPAKVSPTPAPAAVPKETAAAKDPARDAAAEPAKPDIKTAPKPAEVVR